MTREDPPDYFRAVERAFVRLGGGAAFLTPADWDLVRSWEQREIPLAIALSGIRSALLRRRPTSPRTPLRHCAAAVEEAFAARRRGSAGAPTGPAAEPAPRERLERLADSLREWTPAPGAPCAPNLANELEAAVRSAAERVSRLRPDARVETRLAAIEKELVERLQAALPAPAREKIARDSRLALSAHRARMPASAGREALARAVHRRVREAFGIRPLTLFEPEPLSRAP